MTFGLISWLKSRHPALKYEVPVWYPSKDKPDGREWLVTNGLGGYSMGTVSGANRRRYHACLVAALPPPHNRHVILNRIEEVLSLDGREFELSTNHWASGVVSPTGYKFIECFAPLPVPTWVFEVEGNHLIRQLVHPWGTDEVVFGYYWLPDPDRSFESVKLTCKFLVGYRGFHDEVKGSSDKKYSQFVSTNQSVIILDDQARRLCLTWSEGDYESHKQWWWDFRWPTESIRGLPDTEDLFYVGSVTAVLNAEEEFTVGASFENPIHKPDCRTAVDAVVERQTGLIERANLDGSQRADMMLIACDQFLVSTSTDEDAPVMVVEGYPWYNDGGRAAMLSLPGLTVATRRFDCGARLLRTYSQRMRSGIIPNHSLDYHYPDEDGRAEYEGADVTLWWGWALYKYYSVTRDRELIESLLPQMVEAAGAYINGVNDGIKADSSDGLLRCAHKTREFTWMDAKVEGIPITPRPGKAVELCALWYNYLETIKFFMESLEANLPEAAALAEVAKLAGASMQKFWNDDRACLFDVIELGVVPTGKSDDSVRCNQLLAVSLPFRALRQDQEKSILRAVESELLIPMGIRSLSASDPSYQGVFGCGFEHPDRYHRDLCRHQGTGWPWLLGHYCDALINAHGRSPETANRIRLTLQPFFDHFMEEDCLGSISEMFDGNRPHLPRGCPVYSISVAEAMRWLRWVIKQ